MAIFKAWRTATAAFAGFASLTAAGSTRAAPAPCDRGCLRAVLDGYLGAVFRHDPTTAPIAKTLRSTENGLPVALGSGVWNTLRGYGAVQRRYFDPVTGQAAYYGLLDEDGQPVVASLRLKVVGRSAVESEWTIARASASGLFSVEGLIANPPPEGPLPRAERTPRAQLVAAADAYFQGLQDHDGTRVPHVAGCDRVENGVKVTNRVTPPGGPPPLPGAPPAPAIPPPTATGAPSAAQEHLSGDCTANFAMFQHSIRETAYRRYPLVDEEAGVVMGMTLFHRPIGSPMKRNLLTEFFAEKKGRLSFVFAAMYYLDANAPDSSGWN